MQSSMFIVDLWWYGLQFCLILHSILYNFGKVTNMENALIYQNPHWKSTKDEGLWPRSVMQ